MILSGWWYTYPSEKYDFVSWDDDIPNIRRPRQTQGGARQGIRHSTFRVEMQQQQQQQQQQEEQESADPGRRKGERARE